MQILSFEKLEHDKLPFLLEIRKILIVKNLTQNFLLVIESVNGPFISAVPSKENDLLRIVTIGN